MPEGIKNNNQEFETVQDDKENLVNLYEGISKEFNIGSFMEFESKMKTPEDRKKFYNALDEQGYSLGDYDQYENRLKKKEPGKGFDYGYKEEIKKEEIKKEKDAFTLISTAVKDIDFEKYTSKIDEAGNFIFDALDEKQEQKFLESETTTLKTPAEEQYISPYLDYEKVNKNYVEKIEKKKEQYLSVINPMVEKIEKNSLWTEDYIDNNRPELQSLMYKGKWRTPEEEKRWQQLYSDVERISEFSNSSANSLYILKQTRKYIENADAGVLESIYKSDVLLETVSFGIFDILNDVDILKIANKHRDGKTLTEEEQTALWAYGISQMAKEDIPQELSSMIGGGIAETIPFMVEMAMTKGVTAIPKKAGQKLVTKLLRKSSEKVIGRVLRSATGAAIGTAVRVPAFSDFREGLVKRQIGAVMPGITEEGELTGVPIKGTEQSPFEAIGKAYTSTFITVGVEGLGSAASKFGKVTGLNKITKNVLSKTWAKIPKTSMNSKITNSTISQIRKVTDFNSWALEMAEEIADPYIQSAVLREQKLSDVWDNKEMLATGLSLAIMSGSMGAVDYGLTNNNYDRNLGIKALRDAETYLGNNVIADINKILKGDNIEVNGEQLDNYIHQAVAEGANKNDVQNIVGYALSKTRVDEMMNAGTEFDNEVQLSKQELTKEAPVKETTKEAETVATEVKAPKEAKIAKETQVEETIVELKIKEDEKESMQQEQARQDDKKGDSEKVTRQSVRESQKDEILSSPEFSKLRESVKKSKTKKEMLTAFSKSKLTPEQQTKFNETFEVGKTKTKSLALEELSNTIKLQENKLTNVKPKFKIDSKKRYTPELLNDIKEKINTKKPLTVDEQKIWREEQSAPTGLLFDYEGNLKTKFKGNAKEFESGQMRKQSPEERKLKGVSNKNLSDIYGAKLQDRQKKQKESVKKIGNIIDKKPIDLVDEAESVTELDYLLNTGQIKPGVNYDKKSSSLVFQGKIDDINERIPGIEVQRAYQVDKQVTQEIEKDIGTDRMQELRTKKSEALDRVMGGLGRLANLKYAVGEDGKKPDVIKELAGVIRDLGELGIINLELGTRQAIEKLKTYLGKGNDDAIKIIDDNTTALEEELVRPLTEKEKAVIEEKKLKEEDKAIEVATLEDVPKVEKEVSEGKKRRKVAERLLESKKISAEVKEGLSEDALNYIPKSNKLSELEAETIINVKKAITGNLDKSVTDVTNLNNEISPRVRVTMATKLLMEINQQLRTSEGADRTKLKNDAINIAESMTKFGTELGQGVQAFAIWSHLNEETVIDKFNKDLEKQRGRKLTEAEERELKKFKKKVDNARAGFQKQKAVTEMLAFQMRLEGIKWSEVAMSVWYAHVLSGYSTQQLNFMANLAETAMEVLTSVIYNPKKAPWLLKGLYEGYGRGLLEAFNVLKTGYSPIKSIKFEMDLNKPSVLEVIKGVKIGKRSWNPFRYHKYVGRIMSAVDTFFYHGLKGMRTYELAHREIKGQGKGFAETNKLINEKLGNTKERLKNSKEIAKLESSENIDLLKVERSTLAKDLRAEKNPEKIEIIKNELDRVKKEIEKGAAYKIGGADYKRRVFELMEQSVSDEILEDANDFASRGTFNYAAEGRLGSLTDGVAAITNTEGIKAAKFVVPFTRIVSNVANRYLDYSPVGYYRFIKGGIGKKPKRKFGKSKYSREFTQEERTKEFIKASLGTLSAVTLFMLSGGGDDEDKGFLEITGAGTGDYKKNYLLKEQGWQAYSIKFGNKWYSYANTPLAIPMSVIGNIRDRQKYRGETLENKTVADKTGMVVWQTFKYFTDLTFLKGLSEFLSEFSEDESERPISYLAKFTTGVGKSFVMPNLFTQVSRQTLATLDMPLKEAKTITEKLIRDIPFARKGLNDMINVFGEPVIPDTDRYISEVEYDPVIELMVKNNAYVGAPTKNINVFDLDSGEDRPLTNDEFYDYAKYRGQKIKSLIEGNYDELNTMDKVDVQKIIKGYTAKASKEAKSDLLFGRISFGLSDIKKESPKAYEALKEYKQFHEPTSSKSIYLDDGKRFLNTKELDNYRKKSLSYYVTVASEVTNNFNKEIMSELSKEEVMINNKSNNLLTIELDNAWKSAQVMAFEEIANEINIQESMKK